MITDLRQHYRPFEYNEPYEIYLMARSAHWTPDEVNIAQDILNWNKDLTEDEKQIIGGILKGFTQMEVLVGDYWRKIANWFPKPEIQMMCSAFSYFETIHQTGYALINEQLGLDDFKAFLYDETTKNKLDYFLENGNNDVKSVGTKLAIFSAFGEGVSLFSSFAILLSFQRLGLMKGVGQIVSWSIRDENCFGDNTEVLTDKGFIKFSELTSEHLIAQVSNSLELDFVKPLNYICKPISDKMVRFKSDYTNSLMTKDHELLIKSNDKVYKVKAEDFKTHSSYLIPVTADFKTNNLEVEPLTTFQRFCIAVQADGHVNIWTNHEGIKKERGINGGYNVTFGLTKKHKIDRLIAILDELKYEYKRDLKSNGKCLFNIKCPMFNYKSFDWCKEIPKDRNWCNEFIHELLQWDGHIRKDSGTFIYCSTNKECIDVAQYIGFLAGYRTNIYCQEDNRKESYKKYYRLSLYDKDKHFVTSNSLKKSYEDYDGNVYCVTVPAGNIVTRLDDKVFIAGNCHSNGGVWIFNKLCEETPGLKDELKLDVINAATTIYDLEIKFLSELFKDRNIRTLNYEQLENFIRNRINKKLEQMGYEAIYKVNNDLLSQMSWFNLLSSGKEFGDFFAVKPTAYTETNFTTKQMW